MSETGEIDLHAVAAERAAPPPEVDSERIRGLAMAMRNGDEAARWAIGRTLFPLDRPMEECRADFVAMMEVAMEGNLMVISGEVASCAFQRVLLEEANPPTSWERLSFLYETLVVAAYRGAHNSRTTMLFSAGAADVASQTESDQYPLINGNYTIARGNEEMELRRQQALGWGGAWLAVGRREELLERCEKDPYNFAAELAAVAKFKRETSLESKIPSRSLNILETFFGLRAADPVEN